VGQYGEVEHLIDAIALFRLEDVKLLGNNPSVVVQ
jgi:hypothetical protein